MGDGTVPDEGAHNISRRDALSMLAGVAVGGSASADDRAGAGVDRPRSGRRFRIRTLSAGVTLAALGETGPVESALDFLAAARARVAAAGYEVQTIRIVLNPLLLDAAVSQLNGALSKLERLDRLAAERGAMLSVGPVFANGAPDGAIGAWAVQFVRATQATSFSVAVASASRGVHAGAVRTAAIVISALAAAVPDGTANFRFAAAASVPAGTPFFPVAYHDGTPSLAVGLESANLVTDAFAGAANAGDATDRLRALLNSELRPIADLARALAAEAGRRYLGIDASPAPGIDSSIGRAIETLTGRAFGAASTLQACAAITAALKSLDVERCGYSGLMLPVLEDPVLAARAAEGRVRLTELLLYSSVCGTGLDVVPVPGATTATDLARIVGDVATLSVRLGKPLSARLLPMTGRRAGEAVTFTDPRLCASKVLAIDD